MCFRMKWLIDSRNTNWLSLSPSIFTCDNGLHSNQLIIMVIYFIIPFISWINSLCFLIFILSVWRYNASRYHSPWFIAKLAARRSGSQYCFTLALAIVTRSQEKGWRAKVFEEYYALGQRHTFQAIPKIIRVALQNALAFWTALALAPKGEAASRVTWQRSCIQTVRDRGKCR